MKLKRITLYNDTYDFDLLVQLGGSVRDLHTAYFKKVWVDTPVTIEDNANRKGNFISLEGSRNGAIWLSYDASPGVVAHEAFHATVNILNDYGLTLSKDSEEAYAYLQQWMVNRILKEF